MEDSWCYEFSLHACSAQPLFDHDQAKQKLVIVLSAGLVDFEEFLHRLRL
jgi:hypothetical protein